MSATPLRHYYAAPERPRADGDADTRVCQRAGCARPASDAVHLPPGDDDARFAAIEAATAGANPEELDVDRAPAVRARRRARGASRSG